MSGVTTAELEISARILEERSASLPIAVYEDNESYIFFVQLPVVDEKMVHVQLNGGVITIEGSFDLQVPSEIPDNRCESISKNYSRRLDLLGQIDETRIEAIFKSGLLQLTLGKKKTEQVVPIKIKAPD